MTKHLRDKRYKFLNQCEDIGLSDPWPLVTKMYRDEKKSCNEISEWFFENHKIKVTPKYLSEKLKASGDLRDHRARKLNAIKSGRMVYKKKSPEELYIAKSISLSTRIAVFERDNHKCQICGNGPDTNYSIEIHHKNPDSNKIDDLQTLCYLCHKGLHEEKRSKKLPF